MAATLKSLRSSVHYRRGVSGIWLYIVLYWTFPFAFYFAHLSSLTNYLFPLFGFVLGVKLYRDFPTLYVSNMWWLWFVTPEIRRLVDYQIGFQPVDPIMLTPYLVTGLAFFTVINYLPELRRKTLFPMALVVVGILYAYVVGMLTAGFMPATYGLLNWLLPVLFGLHMAIRWRDYPQVRRTLYHTFVWGTLVMGGYGLIQYAHPLPWDAYWMAASKLLSIGRPEPFQVRIFSTMNSPGPFAFELMGTLLMLFAGGGFWRIPAALFGYLAFLLSIVRAAWGGWFIGLVYIMSRLKPEQMLRYFMGIIVIVILATPMLLYKPVYDRLEARFSSIENVKQNASYQARTKFYEEFFVEAFETPLGAGIGSTGTAARLGQKGHVVNFDSGIMEIPYVLGWAGGTLFFLGTIWTLISILNNKWSKKDPFIAISSGISLAVFSTLIFVDTLIGSTGMLFWAFAGTAIAGIHYRQVEGMKND
ncbi:hypothetical protein [Acidithiobacillus sulfurivorans]|uniref:Glucose-6-phosphate isomerase n=1 Tax=Acidithiobacillus sulfurivorans TaxID=1958756 RepID=A0ABS6A2C2_9PROT|nr:hypothetical protein [Acidithiobacillus sulfurivorans]MBU2760785.1 hypothetical protein [Acidithiobacillus sulfurivorans]